MIIDLTQLVSTVELLTTRLEQNTAAIEAFCDALAAMPAPAAEAPALVHTGTKTTTTVVADPAPAENLPVADITEERTINFSDVERAIRSAFPKNPAAVQAAIKATGHSRASETTADQWPDLLAAIERVSA